MKRRETWRPILDAEVKRWSELPVDQLIEKLRELQAYEVTDGGKKYQVEVDVLENTESYVHFCVSVDDGSLPHSIFPLSESIIRYKTANF